MRFKVLILFILISLITAGCYRNNTLTTEEKIADFNQLYDEVKKGYPFLEVNKRQTKEDWLAKKEIFKKRIMKTSSDQDFANELDAIMKELNNGHTNLLNNKTLFNEYKEIYGDLGWYNFFSDEDVINMYNSLEQGKNYPNEEYKDIELKDLVKNEVGYMYIPQMNSANGSIKDDMNKINYYLNKIKNYKSLVIDIRGNIGGTDEYWIELVSLLTDKVYNCKGYRLFRNNSSVIKNYTKVRNIELNDISEFPKDIIKNAPKEVTNIFTDFEYNKVVIKGKSKTPFKGKIYLLVDDMVFSGAESFAIFCKEQNFATIVGSKTGGDGYVYDPVLFKLNNSCLIARMSSTMYLTSSGICDEENKVIPDIEVNDTLRNKILEFDECINKVLELE
ncbi:TPA: S41 family peptidase [Clostridioides difficile]